MAEFRSGHQDGRQTQTLDHGPSQRARTLLHGENRALETSLRHVEIDRNELKDRLDKALGRVETLSRQLGEEYVRGVMDTLQRMGQFPAEKGEDGTKGE